MTYSVSAADQQALFVEIAADIRKAVGYTLRDRQITARLAAGLSVGDEIRSGDNLVVILGGTRVRLITRKFEGVSKDFATAGKSIWTVISTRETDVTDAHMRAFLKLAGRAANNATEG